MDKTEQLILKIVEQNKGQLISFARDLYLHGEPGYREFRTAAKVAGLFRELGLETEEGLAVTGVKGRLSREHDVTVAAIGELDGIKCPAQSHANPENGISHACGHHIQLTAMMGAAIALSHPEVKAALGGNAVFFAVPSEEFSDLDYKDSLMRQGKIRYGGGKAELIRIGAFDDINVCVNHHLHMVDTHHDVLLGNNTTNGFVCKVVKYTGKASHAAIAPEKGINALNAASIGLSALAFQRETFRDEDHVRVHPIMTRGGDMVNVIPQQVELEAQVRAKTMSAMLDASHKTNRAFEAGAHAIGAKLTIVDYPGYLPVLEAPVASALMEAGRAVSHEASVGLIDPQVHNSASTDVGDLTHLMPVAGFTTGGFSGSLHSADFEIVDEEKAYLLPVKVMALTMYHLLKDGAKGALELMDHFPQHLSKQEYLEYMEGFYQNRKSEGNG